MKKAMLVAGLLGAAWIQDAMAAGRCYSQADIEAEQAILFQTNIMVISSACQNTTYAEFRLRNRDPIVHYQKAMIEHFRRGGERRPDRAFETYITSKANQFSMQQNGVPTGIICQQSAELMRMASSLEPTSFRQYAATQAVSASGTYARCTK